MALHSKLPTRDPKLVDPRFDWSQLGKAPVHFSMSAEEMSARAVHAAMLSWEGHEKMNVIKLTGKYAAAGISNDHPLGRKPDDCLHCDICQRSIHTAGTAHMEGLTRECKVQVHVQSDFHRRYESEKYRGFIGVQAVDTKQYDRLTPTQINI